MKKLILLLFTIVMVVGSCTDRDDLIGGVNIRVKNNTDFNFVKVHFGVDDKVYENVASNEYSEYLEYEKAYQDSYVSIEADSTSYTHQSAEFAVADSLQFGFYTYELSISEAGEVLLNFKVD